MNTKIFFAFLGVLVLLMQGCASSVGLDRSRSADVAEWQTNTQAVARAANTALPAINDVNSCPDGMPRTKHVAGGSAASNVKVTEQGTTYTTTAEGGQSHKCAY